MLADQPPGAGAERRLHGGLPGPGGGPRDQQAADVDAGDEQQDGHRDRQRDERTTHIAGRVEVQRHGLELPARRAVEGVRRRDLAADAGDVGERVGDATPGRIRPITRR